MIEHFNIPVIKNCVHYLLQVLALPSMKLLMVCLGNICRSPIAEGVMKQKIILNGLNWEVHSAGTESYHIGEPPHRFSQWICSRNGIDISAQRARQFDENDFSRYDKIFAMATDVMNEIKFIAGNNFNAEKAELFLNSLHPGAHKSVSDPWSQPKEAYSEVFDMIAKGCDAIIEKYRFGI